jgi:hypothetical protein
VSKLKGVCATNDEVTAFYKANPKFQFMFHDNNYDFNDYEVLFESYINTVNYVTIDPSYLSSVVFFSARSFLIANLSWMRQMILMTSTQEQLSKKSQQISCPTKARLWSSSM